MSTGKIAVRYARALFLSAKEHEVLDKVRHDMELLCETTSRATEVKQLLVSPIVDSGNKLRILSTLFAGRLSSLSLDFLKLVIRNKREEFIPGMCRVYIDMYKKEMGIMQANIVTASRLRENTRDEIIAMIREAFDAEIELNEEINKDIIGGMVLRVEDRQLDASVKGKLARIKKELQA